MYCQVEGLLMDVKLLVLDPEKRVSLDDVQKHPWIVKHCIKGERATQRSFGSKDSKPAGQDRGP